MTRDGRLFGLSNRAYYAYKRNNWMLDPSRLIGDQSSVSIDRPIFLLGTQGGGLTLVSRMIRRNEQVVSVTGNHGYWAGADEMQNVLSAILPPTLTGLKHKAPPDEVFGTPREWLYATDRLLPAYRNTADDVTPEVQRKLENTLRWLIRRNARGARARFTDKSQLYTVKVSYIAKMLADYGPKFLLVVRNPYAMCIGRVERTASLRMLEGRLSFEERLELASQHWANSIACALEDGEKVDNFEIVRLEDVLKRPERELRKICDFLELEFNAEMMPQPHHRLPFGSERRDRWYPLREDVNERHLQQLKPEYVEIISGRCSDYADRFGYDRPTP